MQTQLILEPPHEGYFIQSYSPGKVTIHHQVYEKSLLISPHRLIKDWEVSHMSQLKEQDLFAFEELKPQIILLGCDEPTVFPSQDFIFHCLKQGIGIEVMTNYALCGTFNILASEGRKVAAGIIL